jgi:hypothetical protein
MVAKPTMLACSALTAMVMLAAPAAHAAASNGDGGWWDKTSISGRMYWDMSWIDAKTNGVKNSKSGYGFDIKRFYVSIDHKFNDTFSGDVTTDIKYSSGVGATLFVKKAYLQAKISDALKLRLGATDLPWIPFVEGVYGKRYVENTLVDRDHFGTSSDWGVHAMGKLVDGHVSYDLAVVNGAGYRNINVHSKSLDFEGRVSVNYSGFVAGVGGYVGKLGKDTEGTTTYHTASRIDGLVGYVNKQIHLGFEYFYAENWGNVTTPISDKADGYSVFGSYQFNPQWGVFGRYDYTKPNKDTASKLNDEYYNFGLQWSPTKIVDFSLVYKHDTMDDNVAPTNSKTDEVGVFSRFRW